MFKHIYSVIFFFIFITGPISSEEKIVFIDIDKVIYQSDLGKKLNKKITNEIKKEDSKLKKREQEDDKKIPEDIMAQQFDAFEYPLIEEGFDILEKVH